MMCPEYHSHSFRCHDHHGCRCEKCVGVKREASRRYEQRRRDTGANVGWVTCTYCGARRSVDNPWVASRLCPDCRFVLTETQKAYWGAEC